MVRSPQAAALAEYAEALEARAAAQRRVDELAKDGGPNTPELIEARAQLDAAREKVQDIETALLAAGWTANGSPDRKPVR